MNPKVAFAGALLVAAAARAVTDPTFSGTAKPACFTKGGEGAISVKVTNTTGEARDGLVVVACGPVDADGHGITWELDKVTQDTNNQMKLASRFLYSKGGIVGHPECIRAQPAAPGPSLQKNEVLTMTFPYRVSTALAVRSSPEPLLSPFLFDFSAFSLLPGVDKHLSVPECDDLQVPRLTIVKTAFETGGTVAGYRLDVYNAGTAPTHGEIIVEDIVPEELLIGDSQMLDGDEVTVHQPELAGSKVRFRTSAPLEPASDGKPSLFAVIRVKPRPGVSGRVTNTATVCGGGAPDAPCASPRSSTIKSNVAKPTGPAPTADAEGPAAGTVGEALLFLANSSSSTQLAAASPATARDSTPTYAWFVPDVPLVPAALGPRFTHTFSTPGKKKVSLVAVANSNQASRDLVVNVAAAAPSCAANATTLCLLGGRFRVQVDWQAMNNGTNGAGHARPITSDTGAFWFFDAANLELIVKVVDGRGLNGKFWVFFGALSDVQYEIKVTDTQTGKVRQYTNPQGHLTSRADTNAFAGAVGALAKDDEVYGEAAGAGDGFEWRAEAAAACVADQGTKKLCLSDRFDVSVTCSVPGGSCAPTPVKLTGDTGYFWFFNSANVELMTKVVDGRGLNGKFWFFYGALSDVQYSIRIKDRVTGAFKDYSNAQGHLGSAADTSALPGQ